MILRSERSKSGECIPANGQAFPFIMCRLPVSGMADTVRKLPGRMIERVYETELQCKRFI